MMGVVELMGCSLLSEEVNFVGFLPLQTYIETKKSIKNGIKCPEEKENLIRSLIIKEHIE